jgi:hypothetical protein
MKLTANDLQYLAGHLGLLVGQARRAPLPFLVALLERRGYDERAMAILARLHPHEAHKLVLWSASRGAAEATGTSEPYSSGSRIAEP